MCVIWRQEAIRRQGTTRRTGHGTLGAYIPAPAEIALTNLPTTGSDHITESANLSARSEFSQDDGYTNKKCSQGSQALWASKICV